METFETQDVPDDRNDRSDGHFLASRENMGYPPCVTQPGNRMHTIILTYNEYIDTYISKHVHT